MQCLHTSKNWPLFTWNSERLVPLLTAVSYKQGLLAGRTLDGDKAFLREAEREILLCDALASCAMDEARLPRSFRIDPGKNGDFRILLEAASNAKKPLTVARLAEWAKWAVPSGTAGGLAGTPPLPADRQALELRAFLAWFNYNQLPAHGSGALENAPALWHEPPLRAGIAYLWFMAVSPYGRESGRLARAVCNLALHRRSAGKAFYSLADSLQKDLDNYHGKLAAALRGGLDITEWLEWFLSRLDHAVSRWEQALAPALRKARLRKKALAAPLNERQSLVFKTMLERGLKQISTSTYAHIADSSSDSALRDLLEMIDWGLMRKNSAGGRSTTYSLNS